MINTHEILLKLRSKEKQITCEILQELQNMENKRGYLQLGHSSLFDYLVRGLGYSEAPPIRDKVACGYVKACRK